MSPKFFGQKEGHRIVLTKAAQDDPKLKFRKEVEKVVKRSNGKISTIAKSSLYRQWRELKIEPLDAELIISEVLRPYQEYAKKLEEYEQTLLEALSEKFPFSMIVHAELQEYEEHLGLSDEDLQSIKARVIPPMPKISKLKRFTPQPVEKEIATKQANFSAIFSRRNFLTLIGLSGGSFLSAFVWEIFKPKLQNSTINDLPDSTPSKLIQSPSVLPTSTSSPNSTRLNVKTLEILITVDASGKEINRRAVQRVQYFVEDKIILPSSAKQIEMALIPAGVFKIGSPSNESGRSNNESPQRDISFAQPFYVSRYEVTQRQWFTIMGSDYDKDGFKKRFGELDNKFKGDNRPMVMVSWNDAKAYCNRLSGLTGRSYRLPSEAEWEYSCRAKTTTPFYFGETITSDLVNYCGDDPYANAAKGTYRKVTTDVGSFPPNEYGLQDMHGNVWEWCEDVGHENYNGIPQDGTAWLSGGEQDKRLCRGGSFGFSASGCRSARRNWGYAGFRDSVAGFRVVVSILS